LGRGSGPRQNATLNILEKAFNGTEGQSGTSGQDPQNASARPDLYCFHQMEKQQVESLKEEPPGESLRECQAISLN
jgi:hypothetical protein